MNAPGEFRHQSSSTDGAFALGGLYRSLRAHLRVEPGHLPTCDGLVYPFPQDHGVPLAGPYPETGRDAAEGQGAYGESYEFDSRDTDTMKKSGLGFLWWVRCERELSEGVEDLSDDEGHERGDAACDD